VKPGEEPLPRLRRETDVAPNRVLEQAFEILTRGNDERLTIDPPEPSQTKTPHPVPLLALSKEWFDPHFALVERFLIRKGGLVSFQSVCRNRSFSHGRGRAETP
jgi:hypothetical protein